MDYIQAHGPAPWTLSAGTSGHLFIQRVGESQHLSLKGPSLSQHSSSWESCYLVGLELWRNHEAKNGKRKN